MGDIRRGTDPARFPRPDRDQYGRPVDARPVARMPERRDWTDRTVGNAGLQDSLRRFERSEVERGRYYWHDEGGERLAHYVDDWGFHWWGFFIAGECFWTRYYMDRYWFYDPAFARWDYWNEGHWWWQDPADASVVFIYRGGRYYRYDRTANGVVLEPDQTQPTSPLPGPAAADGTWYYSDDGTRAVQVAGAQRSASLFDETQLDENGDPQFLASLGQDVVNVQFSDTSPDANGVSQPLQIVVTEQTADGSQYVTAYDGQGDRLGALSAPDAGAAPLDSPMGSGLSGSGAFQSLEGGVGW
ncbi:MAG: hypothetical protein KGL53_09245 [Elusimicrobia bacterium]|nr:hypothetical protein [Elusimicrobiota bacterium]